MLIAFDVDGTILDVFTPYRKAAEIYCNVNQLPVPTDEELQDNFGNTHWQGYAGWGETFEEQDKHRHGLYDAFHDIQEAQPDIFKLFDGVEEMLKNLSAKDIHLAVVTSRPKDSFHLIAKHLNIIDMFHHINTGIYDRPTELREKPHPDKLLHVMKTLDKTPEQTIMIGDTVMDISMAKSANASSIGVTWGMGNKDDMIKAGANDIVDDIEKLEQVLYKFID